MRLWRISAFPDLKGIGGAMFPARWHSAGRPITYLGESAPGAMLEVLVHLEIDSVDLLPDNMKWVMVDVPVGFVITQLTAALPAGWKADESVTRAIGDQWLQDETSALLRVPSALTPQTHNVLLNPAHPDAAKITIVDVSPVIFDQRLVKAPAPTIAARVRGKLRARPPKKR